ncbi:MAG: MBL fold metallo-hydrolase [Armatimonadetes bacterium]|nr:MBL fold metallo-hydrolase [Anaerolineae bacterium]
MNEKPYRFTIGAFQLTVFKGGGGPSPLARIASNATEAELAQIAAQEGIDPNAIEMSMNLVLIQTGQHTVLVDTGLPSSNLSAQLQAHGVPPESVDWVIITHGHRDHIGGILDADGDWQYPNARYAIATTEWEASMAQLAAADDATLAALRVWQTLQQQQERVMLIATDGQAILPGISAMDAPGHTVGHIALMIESDGAQLLHLADAAHHYIQTLRPDWSPQFDADTTQSVPTRRRLFALAAQQQAQVLAYHFTFPGLGTITQAGDALRWHAVK